jgi:hypothetical protein
LNIHRSDTIACHPEWTSAIPVASVEGAGECISQRKKTMLAGCPHADHTAENLELNSHTRETNKYKIQHILEWPCSSRLRKSSDRGTNCDQAKPQMP